MNDELKQSVLQHLSKGREKAISKDSLCQHLDLKDDREMRIAIKELRHERHLIGLSLKKPTGYFIIETVEELLNCMKTLRNYCVEAALTRRDLKVAGKDLLEELKEKELAKTGQMRLI